MSDLSLWKWRHVQADIILCAVRWSLRDAVSDRDVEELLRARGVWVDQTTVCRWVQRSAPELDQRCQPSLRATHDASHVDETSLAQVGRVRRRPRPVRPTDGRGSDRYHTRELLAVDPRDAAAGTRETERRGRAPSRPSRGAQRGQDRRDTDRGASATAEATHMATTSWVIVIFGEPISGEALHIRRWIKIYQF
jgi:hypothetical protein